MKASTLTEIDVAKTTIFLGIGGSHAYGTATNESDYDLVGISIPPKEYFLSYDLTFEQCNDSVLALYYERTKPILDKCKDITVYNIVKFFRLAAECNPNIIELLYLPLECTLLCRSEMKKVLSIRDAFLSRAARFRFGVLAFEQLKRIKTHRRWLLNPPKQKPERKDFGLDKHPKLSKGNTDALLSLGPDFFAAAQKMGLSEEFVVILKAEKSYQHALRDYNLYMQWKIQRNPERAKLEEKFGYDTKHAMHLVRLMRMAKEILTTGKVVVRRPDAEELRAILKGCLKYEEVEAFAENQDTELNGLMEKSPLPENPNTEVLRNTCISIIEERIIKYENN